MGITVGRRTATPSSDTANGVSRYARNAPPEEEAPRSSRRGRTAASNGHEEPARGRGRSRGESGGSDEAAPVRKPQRGWSGSKKTRQETSDFADRYKLNEADFDLIAFLEDEPFDSAPRHFIDVRVYPNYTGQRSFICPGKSGPYKCALCAAGDKAMPVDYFNIAVFDTADPESDSYGTAEVKVWEAGPGYSNDIMVEEGSRAVGGHLSSVYFEVKGVKAASGKGATKLKINVVRESDMVNEWHIEPLSDAEFAALGKDMKGEGYVKFSPERALREAADKLNALSD